MLAELLGLGLSLWVADIIPSGLVDGLKDRGRVEATIATAVRSTERSNILGKEIFNGKAEGISPSDAGM